MKIVLLNGSPRRGGNTEIMINTFMENVKDHDVVKLNIVNGKNASAFWVGAFLVLKNKK